MIVNIIVAAVTLMVGGFVTAWLVFPRFRPWIEAPKWQPLGWDEWEESFHETAMDEVERDVCR